MPLDFEVVPMFLQSRHWGLRLNIEVSAYWAQAYPGTATKNDAGEHAVTCLNEPFDSSKPSAAQPTKQSASASATIEPQRSNEHVCLIRAAQYFCDSRGDS